MFSFGRKGSESDSDEDFQVISGSKKTLKEFLDIEDNELNSALHLDASLSAYPKTKFDLSESERIEYDQCNTVMNEIQPKIIELGKLQKRTHKKLEQLRYVDDKELATVLAEIFSIHATCQVDRFKKTIAIQTREYSSRDAVITITNTLAKKPIIETIRQYDSDDIKVIFGLDQREDVIKALQVIHADKNRPKLR